MYVDDVYEYDVDDCCARRYFVRCECIFMGCVRRVSVWENCMYECGICFLDIETQEKSEEVSFIPIVRDSASWDNVGADENDIGRPRITRPMERKDYETET